MDECKRPSPGNIAHAFHSLGSFGRVYRNFPKRVAPSEHLSTDEVRAESSDDSVLREAFKGESKLESTIISKWIS
jgi:hypothetical protein